MIKPQYIRLWLFFIGAPFLSLVAQQTAHSATIESFFEAFHQKDSLQFINKGIKIINHTPD